MRNPLPCFSVGIARSLALLMMLMLPLLGWGQVNIAGGNTVTESFDNAVANAKLSSNSVWKIDAISAARVLGTYAGASTTPNNTGGANISSSATSGTYTFTSTTLTSDRAVGGLSASSSNRSVNVYTQLKNTGTTDIASFSISYNIEKYRAGNNANGYTIQLYYSADGSTWTPAPAGFTTSFVADGTTVGYAATPATTTAVSATLTQTVAAGSNFYLAWNYSPTSGTSGSNAQALGIDDVSITATSSGSATPTITVSPATALSFSTTTGTPSDEQTYNVGGTNLTGAITATAPAGYEISLTSGTYTGTAANALTLTPTGGTVSSTPIYVRLTGATTGTYGTSGIPSNIVHTSTSAADVNKPVYGVVTAPTPTITVSPTTALSFSTTTGTPSTEQSYTVGGSTLTAAITATAPSGYEVALETTAGSNTPGMFGASVATAAPSGGTVTATKIYVRLTGATTGTYGTSGTPFNVVHTSSGATNANKPVYGTVTAPTPTIIVTPATALTFATSTGTPSAEQTYSVSATSLTANLTVTAPAGYEISLTSGTYTGTGANMLTLTPSAGTVGSTPIYVHLIGTAAGSFSGNIANASTGAGTKNIAVSGTVTTPALATYSMTTTTGRAASAPATAKDANISTADAITRSATLSTSNVASGSGIFGASGWGALTNLADALAGDKFFAFAITPTLGYLANVTTITGNAYRTSTAPTTVELLYSTNSDFTNPVSLGTQPVSATAAPGTAFSFPLGQSFAYPIYFRLYGYGSTNTSGNFYFVNGTSTPGLVVNGNTSPSPQPVIATGTVSPAVCGGSPTTVSYTTGGPAATGTYFVQLSDANGSFAAPVSLATVSSTSTSITATIPGTTASGTGYRVRVANTDGTIGSTSVVFTVVSSPTATVAPAAPQTINAGTPGTALTVTETPAAGSRQWYYGTTAGGPYPTAIGTATGLTYTPNFPTAGIYYVVAQSTFAACGSVISNEVIVTVTAPTLAAAPTSLSGFITNTGTASGAQSYVLTGTGVLAPVTVTAPTGFEVSLDGTAFAASVSVAAASANAGQTIYVRLVGAATGSVSGTVTNAVGGTSVSVSVSGDVLTPPGMLLVEDDFDYTGQLNANGWSGTATSSTTASNILFPTYPRGAVLTAGGNSRQASIDGNSGSTLFRTTTIPTSATTLYAAALINVSIPQNVSGNDYLFAFQTTNGTVSYRGRVTIARVSGSSPTKFTFKIRASSETTATVEATPTQFSINTDYLLVMKAENSPATNNVDRFSLYVLPSGTSLSQEPATPLLTIDGVNVFSDINGFIIREVDTNNPTFTMDSFRFATGWGAAVGNPVYSAPTADINPGSYYNVTVNNNGQASQTGTVTIENQLALPSGKLDLNGRLLTLAGTVSGSGALAGSATSSLSVLGTGALGTLNFAPGAQTLNNLTLNRTSTGTVILGTPLTVGGTLTLTSGIITTNATNLLTLNTGATVSGGSASSFVRGPLARATGAGAATTVFPVGKGTFYRPITLISTAQAAASTYTAEQFESNPSRTLSTDPGKGTAPLARVSSKRFYTVNSSNTTAGNFTGTITLSFGAEDYVNVPSDADLVIAKRDATGAFANQWTNLGRSTNTGTDSGAGGPSVVGTLTSASFSDFSDFALGAQNDLSTTNVLDAINPLPVQLTAFSAQRQADKTVAVKWATATEKNSARFDVQRSFDGREFATIATVAAQGNSMSPKAYATLDKAAPAAKLYYRLLQVDLDGTTAFSPIVTVAGSGEIAKVELYPNPARTRISFITEAATPYRVLNQLGQPLLRGTTEAGTANIGLEALPTGLYFLELQTAAGRTVQKFEKE
ncbi:MAG: C-terminal target protein [Hymenobacter sp.]|nr:C-terminal target protein [Hymenobacter sp.]